jgi:hypothetical protein
MLALGISELVLSLSILLIISITALVSGRIARSKNRNEMMWTVLGFCFAFVSVAVIAFLPEREVPVTPEDPTGRMKAAS